MPTRTDWCRVNARGEVTLLGRYRATKRGAAMLRAARVLFTKRTGRSAPVIIQGGLNGTNVKASGGTHAREAFDTNAGAYSKADRITWQTCMRQVGFADWDRPAIKGVWSVHNHAIPKGGDLSDSAAAQTRNFAAGETGLTGHRKDPSITAAQKAAIWEKYQAAQKAKATITIGGQAYPDITSVSVYWLAKNWGGKVVSRHVAYLQQWLTAAGYPCLVDGLVGPKTRAALDAYRSTIRYTAAPGSPPDLLALQALATAAHATKSIRTGK